MPGIVEEALEDGSVDIYSMLDDDLVAKRDAMQEEFEQCAHTPNMSDHIASLDEAIDRFEAEMASRGLM